ncbi:hypothetical protein BJ742DRAFT_410143 [Cladochytrium replicatum]|nr:hypothetical protein BJ742DRAFT_410143 [Cladochytrium replicatum]
MVEWVIRAHIDLNFGFLVVSIWTSVSAKINVESALLAATALYVATMGNEEDSCSIERFLGNGGIGYTEEKIFWAQRKIFSALKGNLRAATAADFLHIFHAVDPQPLVRSTASYLPELELAKSDSGSL